MGNWPPLANVAGVYQPGVRRSDKGSVSSDLPVRPGPGRRPARRDELIALASELFASRGYSGVTMDDIGAAAGVSGPALYHHFASKEALLGEMLVTISAHLLAAGRHIQETLPPLDRLDALISQHVDFAVDRRALITVHFRDLVQASDTDRRTVHELQRRYVDTWVDAVLARRPAIGPRVARAGVHAAFGLVNSTPISGRLRRQYMVQMLRQMTHAALASIIETPIDGD